jgi:rubrerythrin
LRAVTTWDVFRRAERIEALAAAIYGSLAKQFAGDPDARALFARLEQEELQHAARVRLLASRYRGDKKILENVAGAAEIEACVAVVEKALAEVAAGEWGTDLVEIRRRLVALEGELHEAHAQCMSTGGHPALRDFFRQLALQDDGHAALLGK